MGDFGKISAANYEHNRMTAQRVGEFESALAAWLATAPGSFTSQDACVPYDKALARFSQWSGRSEVRDDFEIALARLGFRAGVCVFNGEPLWILALPSSVDSTLDRTA